MQFNKNSWSISKVCLKRISFIGAPIQKIGEIGLDGNEKMPKIILDFKFLEQIIIQSK